MKKSKLKMSIGLSSILTSCACEFYFNSMLCLHCCQWNLSLDRQYISWFGQCNTLVGPREVMVGPREVPILVINSQIPLKCCSVACSPTS